MCEARLPRIQMLVLQFLDRIKELMQLPTDSTYQCKHLLDFSFQEYDISNVLVPHVDNDQMSAGRNLKRALMSLTTGSLGLLLTSFSLGTCTSTMEYADITCIPIQSLKRLTSTVSGNLNIMLPSVQNKLKASILRIF